MRKKILFFLFVGFSLFASSQVQNSDFRKIELTIKKDTIQLDSVPINSQQFKVFDSLSTFIPKRYYKVDFNKAQLFINAKKYPKITVEYFRFPEFITKIYSPFDEKLIQPNETNTGTTYSFNEERKEKEDKLFEGLDTKGFIARGLTSGNNQNAVTNSQLDLEITGQLSEKLGIRAHIFDTNIPIQQNGYSQNLTDFNQIYVELYSDNWRLRAGDISLNNQSSYFMPINKQISGLRVEADINKNLSASASGAIVKGKFNRYNVPITEGNQGPYKLFGADNEANILIIEGSDKVYVKGFPIEAGEDKDYTIDYNLGELRFNTTFPVTNDIRVIAEFQYADRNYTRFLTFEEVNYKTEKLNVNAYFFNENDARNQPVQQDLTDAQRLILANAGDNEDSMIAETAFSSDFNPDAIQYKRSIVDGISFFEFSTNAEDELFNVTFSNVGLNSGNYDLQETTALGNIFVFVGENLGSYSPINQLVAPNRFQTFVVQSDYKPNEKTTLSAEIATSNNDENLFSSIDDENNTALATLVNWQQILIDNKWKLSSNVNFEYVQKNFTTEIRWEPVEFNRTWNILTNFATKNLFSTELLLEHEKKGTALYRYSHLSYPNTYNGNRHELYTKLNLNKTAIRTNASFLKNTSTLEDNTFVVANARAEHSFTKNWLGVFTNIENNSRKNILTQEFVQTSHRFKEFEAYFGIGDSTKVFAKIGANYRNNDSIKNNRFVEINNRRTLYIDSKLIQNKNTNLSFYANYRSTRNNFADDEQSLNSKIILNKKLFNNFVNFATSFESASGNIAQQEYVYVKTEPGQGYYTWIDYNNDGIEDFGEFEIAEFQDQATYLRLPLPNLTYLATQRAKFTQNLNLNFIQWKNKAGIKKIVSHFNNQSFLLVDNEQERSGDSFNFNPFNFDEEKLVGLNFNLRNSLYFNRNLQDYSTTYTFGTSRNKQQFFIGSQENTIRLHQLDFAHKFADFWLAEFTAKTAQNELNTENFDNRNYNIDDEQLQPKISFLYNKDNRFSLFYQYNIKENQLADFEKLEQQKIGLEYFYANKRQDQISATVNIFFNDFTGATNSPVAYQMLEGLQAGRNYTWNFLFNRKLNSYLNLNLSYLGRKSEGTRAIHTGNIQLKAIF
ncbi:hypothetical protein N9V96_02045 [Polaribacter sp.]|nr:hypothetical protein [Polaribacter sp.]